LICTVSAAGGLKSSSADEREDHSPLAPDVDARGDQPLQSADPASELKTAPRYGLHQSGWERGRNCGRVSDPGTPVDDKDYKTPFRFTGKLDKLTLTIDRPKLSSEDIKKLEMAMHHNPAQE